jgi:AAHS family benzoate transporter-like MFS transporter
MAATAATSADTPEQEARRRRTILSVVLIAFVGLLFDGYDLGVFGATLPVFLRDPSQIGPVTPEVGGALGSYVLVGTLVGAVLAGFLADRIGRRKVLLAAFAWCPIGMIVTSFASSVFAFGLLRFITGIGVGLVITVTGALVADFAPPGKKQMYSAIAYCGVSSGILLAVLLAIFLFPALGPGGWRTLFLVGGLPLVTLLPYAWFRLPDSPSWLAARGRADEARAVAERTGVPINEGPVAAAASAGSQPGPAQRTGFAGLLRPQYLVPVILFAVLCLVAQTNIAILQVWLPELMQRAGFSTRGSLSFLLLTSAGAVIGALIVSRFADRLGPQRVIAGCFLLGAVVLWLVTNNLPVALLLGLMPLLGLGTNAIGNLSFGFIANYFPASVRGAAMSWGTSWGRVGNVVGPVLGGVLVGAGISLNAFFYILAGLALVGVVSSLLVPRRRELELHPEPIEPGTAPAVTTDRPGA